MTIFVVTSGEYSAYGIHGVFSSEENALAYVRACSREGTEDGEPTISSGHVSLNGYDIETYEMDQGVDAAKAGLRCYRIYMDRKGISRGASLDVIDLADMLDFYKDGDIPKWPEVKIVPGYWAGGFADFPRRWIRSCLCTLILAKSEEHALKAVNERRAQLIASGEWPPDGPDATPRTS